MLVGSAWEDITPKDKLPIQGQMRLRLGEYAHDPLTANAVAFEDGDHKAALVSVDVCMLRDDFVRSAQQQAAEAAGLPAEAVIIACTHTHLGPCTFDSIFAPSNPAYLEYMKGLIAKAVARAWQDREPVSVYADTGFVEQMGFNRRGMKSDGTAGMYHGSWQEDFAGLEGPRDGSVPVIFARRPDGSLKVVIANFSSHPNSVEGESYYSADFPGAVRAFLRRNLDENVGVVYLTGAAGNTAPSQLVDNKAKRFPWRGEEGWKRSGLYLGSEILKTVAGATEPMADQTFRLAQVAVDIPLRPWPADLDPEKLTGGHRDYTADAKARWPKMMAEMSPMRVRLNVLRVGDAAICTNPAELFCEFGLAMKKASPARVTAVCELADGYVGYVPTPEAFDHGGYETRPADSSLLAREAGGVFVAKTAEMLRQVFGA